MQYPIPSRSRYYIHSNCVPVSISAPPHRPVVCNPHLTFHRISALNPFVSQTPVVLSRSLGTGVLFTHKSYRSGAQSTLSTHYRFSDPEIISRRPKPLS